MLNQVTPVTRGRPRNVGTDAAILEATLTCLARDGYARMSVAAIAAEAGATRPAIYRRWPTKAALTVAAISDLVLHEHITVSGDTRADLVEVVRAVHGALIGQGRMHLFGSIFAEDHHNPDFVRLFREQVIEPRRGHFREALASGIAAGQVRPDVDVAVITDFLIGSFMSRWLSGLPVPEGWPETTVDAIWPAIAADPAAAHEAADTPRRRRRA